MKEFDIRKAREGDVLPCRDGQHNGKILYFFNAQMLVLITGPNPELHGQVIKYNIDGKNQWSKGNDYPHDLMLPNDEPIQYVMLFKNKLTDTLYVHPGILPSIQDAEETKENLYRHESWQLIKIQPVTGV